MDEQILIDKFFVPSNGKEEFIRRMSYNWGFIKKLPGFIAHSAYQKIDVNGNLSCITVAKWESEAFLDKAKKAVKNEYLKTGFNPAEMLERLGITMERGIYQEQSETEVGSRKSEV